MNEPTQEQYAHFGEAVAGIMDGFLSDPYYYEKHSLKVIMIAARTYGIKFRVDAEQIEDALRYLSEAGE